MATEKIPFSIHVPPTRDARGYRREGFDAEFPGFFYVIAFAMRGIPWAVEAALKPEFDKMVRGYFNDQKIASVKRNIEYYDQQIAILKKRQIELEELREELRDEHNR